MKILKICLLILCLLPFRAVGMPQFRGANFFMKEIILTQGKIAFVDDDDYEYLMQWKWFADKGHTTYYARAKWNNKHIKMHRLLLMVTDPEIHVDHKDHNGLNNQRSNIRLSNRSENKCNMRKIANTSSQYIGVTKVRGYAKWTAYINGIHLGTFNSEIEAAIERDKKAIEFHGEFAKLNFPLK